jgi:hypothetical protein
MTVQEILHFFDPKQKKIPSLQQRAGRMGGVKDTNKICAFAVAIAPSCTLILPHVCIYIHCGTNYWKPHQPNRLLTQHGTTQPARVDPTVHRTSQPDPITHACVWAPLISTPPLIPLQLHSNQPTSELRSRPARGSAPRWTAGPASSPRRSRRLQV